MDDKSCALFRVCVYCRAHHLADVWCPLQVDVCLCVCTCLRCTIELCVLVVRSFLEDTASHLQAPIWLFECLRDALLIDCCGFFKEGFSGSAPKDFVN